MRRARAERSTKGVDVRHTRGVVSRVHLNTNSSVYGPRPPRTSYGDFERRYGEGSGRWGSQGRIYGRIHGRQGWGSPSSAGNGTLGQSPFVFL
eukprot:scaffold649_cov347-Pavlova_lutheri.AAC.77